MATSRTRARARDARLSNKNDEKKKNEPTRDVYLINVLKQTTTKKKTDEIYGEKKDISIRRILLRVRKTPVPRITAIVIGLVLRSRETSHARRRISIVVRFLLTPRPYPPTDRTDNFLPITVPARRERGCNGPCGKPRTYRTFVFPLKFQPEPTGDRPVCPVLDIGTVSGPRQSGRVHRAPHCAPTKQS